MVIDMAAGHGPAMQSAFVGLAFVTSSPSLECVFESCDRFGGHALVFDCVTKVKASLDARQLAMRTSGLVGEEAPTVEGRDGGNSVRSSSGSAHSHRSRETKADHAHRAGPHTLTGGEEVLIGGCIAFHRVRRQRRGEFAESFGGEVVPKLKREAEHWKLTGAVEQVRNQDGISLLRYAVGHAEVCGANPGDVDEV